MSASFEALPVVTRGLALALREESARASVHAALRASPWSEHKLHLSEFLATPGGDSVLSVAAGRLGLSVDSLRAAAASLPELDFYLPVEAHRVAWTGREHVVVVGMSSRADGVAFDAEGGSPALDELRTGRKPALVLHPAEVRGLRRVDPTPVDAPGVQAPGESQEGTVLLVRLRNGDSVVTDLAARDADSDEAFPDIGRLAWSASVTDPFTPPPPPPADTMWMTHYLKTTLDDPFWGDSEIEMCGFWDGTFDMEYCARKTGVPPTNYFHNTMSTVLFKRPAWNASGQSSRVTMQAHESDPNDTSADDYYGMRPILPGSRGADYAFDDPNAEMDSKQFPGACACIIARFTWREAGEHNPPVMQSMTVTPNPVSLDANTRVVEVTATPRDQAGRVMEYVPINWVSSDPSRVTVTRISYNKARVEGKLAGTVTVRAMPGDVTWGEVHGSTSVTFAPGVTVTITGNSSTALAVPNTRQLTATVRNSSGQIVSAPLTWSSSNPSRATVSSTGLVTAVASGSAVITASAYGVPATTTVNVSGPQPPAASYRIVYPSGAELGVGTNHAFYVQGVDAYGAPITGTYHAATWSVDNTSIATVAHRSTDNAGVVTGVALGSTTLRATVNGQNLSYPIDVAGQAFAITGFNRTTMRSGDQCPIFASIVGGAAPYTLIWTVDGMTYRPNRDGSVNITNFGDPILVELEARDATGTSVFFSQTITTDETSEPCMGLEG